jgi:hypothetical protein
VRALFDKLTDSYAKYYSVTDHLAVDEIIVLFKGSHLQTIYTKETQAVWDKTISPVILSYILTI